MNTINTDPNSEEKETHHIEHHDEVYTRDGKNIENEKDVHEIEAGNIGEPDAERDMLDGPANDLISQPDDEDDQ